MSKKLLKELDQYIDDSEHIVDTTYGFYEGKHGIIAATSTRLIYLSKGMFSGLRIVDMPYSKIKSIEYNIKRSDGILEIFGLGEEREFTSIYGSYLDNLPKFVKTIQNQINGQAGSSSGKSKSSDKYTQLEKIAKLKEAGVLTEEEFEEEKRKLLDF
ncbi:PH domain-containing protein [Alkalihalobacillus sp. AL-G]|uniref:PH domain-containing protein n=1 Tax=Alkalihalobacillus sp. AL-G TaxID=2926399 RepID=UPI00272D18A3|nr:PH domain-containing protein [Alkalihalobacillus sp. AL-G]WLD92645.1 PH domain-containing protein [Alkalihalobacillus sp. AL-G]